MTVRLRVENYRALKKVDWTLPKGVCALVGPNGSGKTTLLDVFGLLRDTQANGVAGAVARHGSTAELRHFGAPSGSSIEFVLDLDGIEWQVELRPGERGRAFQSGEVITVEGARVLTRKPEDPEFILGGSNYSGDTGFRNFCFNRFSSEDPARGPFAMPAALLSGYRLYAPITFETLRQGSPISTHRVLLERGDNLFAVMRNWHERKETRRRFGFVQDALREAFPDVFDEIDFDSDEKMVRARIHVPGIERPLPASAAPNGVLSLLFLLCAVVSTERGGIVAIDEPENGLHPFAIQRFMDAAREWADQEELTVLLATHSPVLLDRFKDEPDRVFVMDPVHDVLPVPLSEVHATEWLAQFSLGDLYKLGDFGAPAAAVPAA